MTATFVQREADWVKVVLADVGEVGQLNSLLQEAVGQQELLDYELGIKTSDTALFDAYFQILGLKSPAWSEKDVGGTVTWGTISADTSVAAKLAGLNAASASVASVGKSELDKSVTALETSCISDAEALLGAMTGQGALANATSAEISQQRVTLYNEYEDLTKIKFDFDPALATTTANWLAVHGPGITQIFDGDRKNSALQDVKNTSATIVTQLNLLNNAFRSYAPVYSASYPDVDAYLASAEQSLSSHFGQLDTIFDDFNTFQNAVFSARVFGASDNEIKVAIQPGAGIYSITAPNGVTLNHLTFNDAFTYEFQYFLEDGTKFFQNLESGLSGVQKAAAQVAADQAFQTMMGWISIGLTAVAFLGFTAVSVAGEGIVGALTGVSQLVADATPVVNGIKLAKQPYSGLGSSQMANLAADLDSLATKTPSEITTLFTPTLLADFKSYVLEAEHAIVAIGKAAKDLPTYAIWSAGETYGPAGATGNLTFNADGSVTTPYGNLLSGDHPTVSGYLYTDFEITTKHLDTATTVTATLSGWKA